MAKGGARTVTGARPAGAAAVALAPQMGGVRKWTQ